MRIGIESSFYHNHVISYKNGKGMIPVIVWDSTVAPLSVERAAQVARG